MLLILSLVLLMGGCYILAEFTPYAVANFSDKKGFYLNQLFRRGLLISGIALIFMVLSKFQYSTKDIQDSMDFISKGLFRLWCIASMMVTVQYCQMILPSFFKRMYLRSNKKSQV